MKKADAQLVKLKTENELLKAEVAKLRNQFLEADFEESKIEMNGYCRGLETATRQIKKLADDSQSHGQFWERILTQQFEAAVSESRFGIVGALTRKANLT